MDLENLHIRLEVLEETHRLPLRRATEADNEVWTALYPYSMVGEHFDPFWDRILEEKSLNRTIPFAVIREGLRVGITCLLELSEIDRSVNIGGTYYRPDFRGGIVNVAAKFLLLDYAFRSGCARVQFRVDEKNARSRKAVSKIGGIQEGILRNDKVTWTGRVRSTVIFSILDDEWLSVSKTLRQLMEAALPPGGPAINKD